MVSKDHTRVWFVDTILRIFSVYPSLQVLRAETLVERFTARLTLFSAGGRIDFLAEPDKSDVMPRFRP